MAVGDITGQVIAANGRELTFDVEGLVSSSITDFVLGKTATLAVTSEKYTGTSLGTGMRTVATRISSVIDNSGADFRDLFEGTGGADLETRSPDEDVSGNGWTQRIGTWGIASGGNAGVSAAAEALASDGTLNVAIATCDVGDADAVIAAPSIARGTNGRYGVVFRYVDASNYWAAYIQDSGTTAGTLTLMRRQAGSNTTEGTYAIPSGYTNTTTYTIGVSLSGTSIEVFLDGVSRIGPITNSHNATATAHGLWANLASASGRFADFSVNAGAGATITLDLSGPVHDDDTATLTIDDGAFHDGANGSNALAAAAVTNESTFDYTVPSGGLIGVFDDGADDEILVDHSVVAGTIIAEAQFFHWTGIAAVVITASDGVNPDVTTTVTERSRSLHHEDKLVPSEVFAEIGGRFYFRASLDLSSLDDGSITLTADAYPVYGDADAIRSSSWTLYNNSGGGVATAMHAASASGGWQWGSLAVNGGAAGTPPTIYVDSATGNSGNNGTSGSPLQEVHQAINRLTSANANAWASIVLQDNGPHYCDRPNTCTPDAWMRLTGQGAATIVSYDTGNAEYPNGNIARGRIRLSNQTFHLAVGALNHSLWIGKGAKVTDPRGAWHGGSSSLDGFAWTEADKRLTAPEDNWFLEHFHFSLAL